MNTVHRIYYIYQIIVGGWTLQKWLHGLLALPNDSIFKIISFTVVMLIWTLTNWLYFSWVRGMF